MILLDIAKSFFYGKVCLSGVAVDFTMGRGHDTLFLSSLVPEGKVYAFDIQKSALESTRKLLEENKVSNVELILDSHANAGNYIKESVNFAMFNLGYLPGGDKSVHTMTESTLRAVRTALSLLAPAGILTISVYPGHSEGKSEGDALEKELCEIDKQKFSILQCKMLNSPTSPYIIAIERNSKV